MKLRNFTKLYILLELLDILTTLIAIEYFGAFEITPMFANLPVAMVVLAKVIQIAIVMTVLEFPLRVPKLIRPVYWLPAIYFIYPAIHNVVIIILISRV